MLAAKAVEQEREKRKRFGALLGFVLLSITLGILQAGSPQVAMEGVFTLVLHHGISPTDAFAIGGIGGALVNSGLVALIGIIAYGITGTDIGSGEVSAMLMMYGYAFYGKTIFNVVPLLLGVYLYAYAIKEPLTQNSALACYSTALGPVVSTIAFDIDYLGPGTPLAITIGILVGLGSGALIANLSKHMRILIRGNNMYVGGFTAGVVGVLVNSILKSIGLGHGPVENAPVVDQNYRMLLVGIAAVLFLYFIVIGFLLDRRLPYAIRLLVSEKPRRDYCLSHGFPVALMSIGMMGLVALGYFLLIPNTIMHGQIWAGMFTVAAFSVIGLTPRYMYPFVLGMVVSSFLSAALKGHILGEGILVTGMAGISSVATVMATMVGCGMSPLAERFGVFRSMLIGIIYSQIVPNLAVLHGWMNTYNSGFALGLVIILYFTGESKTMKAEIDLYNRLNKYGFLERMDPK